MRQSFAQVDDGSCPVVLSLDGPIKDDRPHTCYKGNQNTKRENLEYEPIAENASRFAILPRTTARGLSKILVRPPRYSIRRSVSHCNSLASSKAHYNHLRLKTERL
jgi:hypothetical protein